MPKNRRWSLRWISLSWSGDASYRSRSSRPTRVATNIDSLVQRDGYLSYNEANASSMAATFFIGVSLIMR